jgi:hypothetical protein
MLKYGTTRFPQGHAANRLRAPLQDDAGRGLFNIRASHVPHHYQHLRHYGELQDVELQVTRGTLQSANCTFKQATCPK